MIGSLDSDRMALIAQHFNRIIAGTEFWGFSPLLHCHTLFIAVGCKKHFKQHNMLFKVILTTYYALFIFIKKCILQIQTYDAFNKENISD